MFFFLLEEYDLCHKSRNTKQGGGVAFFISSIINYTIEYNHVMNKIASVIKIMKQCLKYALKTCLMIISYLLFIIKL